MAAASEKDVLAEIARGAIAPIYCLSGPERYALDRCLNAIRAAVLGPGNAPSFNCDTFELKESGLATALNAAKTLPMFAKKRLVIAKGIDLLKSEELEPLSVYLADPNPSSCLVLVGEKIDGRLRAFAALRKAGHLHDFPRLKDREVTAWIAREVKERKIAMDPDAAHALGEATGPDLGRIDQALEQLAIYAGPGTAITRAHVEDLIAETRERSVFELTKAIGEGNVARSLGLLANMQRNREPALRIQFMLMRQLRQIWRAKEMAAAGAPRGDIASAIGVAPFFLDDLLAPARRLSESALKRSFQYLYDADRTLKSSRIDPDLQVARLVRRLASEGR